MNSPTPTPYPLPPTGKTTLPTPYRVISLSKSCCSKFLPTNLIIEGASRFKSNLHIIYYDIIVIYYDFMLFSMYVCVCVCTSMLPHSRARENLVFSSFTKCRATWPREKEREGEGGRGREREGGNYLVWVITQYSSPRDNLSVGDRQ